MATLFEGIPLERVSTSMTINATAAVLLAMYAALARARGIDPARLRGTIQNDVLKEYVARGTYIFPPSPSMRLVTDAIAFAAASMPLFHAISVSGYHMREAGATAVQEIAFTLANAIAYAMAAIEQGLSADQFLPRLSFFFAAQNDLLEEVAKFRAARWLWAHIARDRLGATDPRSMMLRFHTQTAGVSLTAQQPQNNVVRVALQALAAILGGTQSLHTNSLDEALGLPTPASATLALRTQQILAYESGIADVVDPLAGSYAVESLTCALAQRAQALIVRIDEMGGALAAVDSGWMASQIADSAYQLQREIDEGARVVVGVNRFDTEGGSGQALSVLPIDGNLAQRRAGAIAALRERRDAAGVEGALSAVREAARRDANLLPPLIAAVEARATLGEICDALRAEFGEYRPADAL
jgi:methylmalonyl-CoA mutase N-terminal domain/subunit